VSVNLICYIDKFGYLAPGYPRRQAIPTAMLYFDSNEPLEKRIKALGPLPLDYPLWVHIQGDRGKPKSASAKLDGYGEPLTYLTGKELRKLRVPPRAGPWNQALGRLLTELPERALVVLYWT